MYFPRFKKVFNDRNNEQIEDFIKYLISLDPTYKEGGTSTGDYGTWILDRVLKPNGKSVTEDVKNLLTDFINVKQSLSNKDINAYKSIDELQKAIDSTELSDRQKERRLRKSKDYEIVYEDDD